MRNTVISILILGVLTVTGNSQTIVPGGPVSGTWTQAGSPYLIEGEITIPDGETLNVAPAVEVIFQGHHKFIVNGYLEATGTAEDSIIFTAADTSEGWHGIRFNHAPDSSHLIFCIVQYGYATGSDPEDWGGGIHIYNSNPVISHCLIERNSAVVGGGICCWYSNPTIENCIISENTATGVGAVAGGIYGWESNPTINQCVITGNFGGGIYSYESANPIISQCTITWNAGGIYCNDSSPTISNCTIIGNSASDAGGGITCAWGCNSIISNCIISGNSSINVGGGIGCWDSAPTIENCTISGNSTGIGGGGIYCEHEHGPTIVNVIVEGNIGNGGIYFNDSPNVTITYGDFYNNEGSSFIGNTIPAYLGEIVAINTNGDSCDIFFNIYEDPLFVNEPLSDYHLSPDSPCIDAGNPFVQYNDPEDPLTPGYALWPAQGTILNDMGNSGGPGARDWVVGIKKNPSSRSVPSIFNLQQNYPNPFNPSTVLSYQLSVVSNVTLSVYDVSGRKVAELVDGWRDAGQYEVTFDASHLPSGIYFARLTAGDFTSTGKMILMK